MVKTTKTFPIPGQKKETPPKNNGLYIFYTTLLKQRSDSKMAITWCLEHGVFPKKKAEQLLLQMEMEKLAIKEAAKKSTTSKKSKDKGKVTSNGKAKA